MEVLNGWSVQSVLRPWCLLWLAVHITQITSNQASSDYNLNLENLPNTTFSCEGKVVGGYYADVETSCQMFHVCTLGQKGETKDIKFLCLQGTVFDQKTRVCERDEEVNCERSASYYDINKELYQNNNNARVEFDGNITDSVSEASVTHLVRPGRLFSDDYDDSQRYEAASATGSDSRVGAAFDTRLGAGIDEDVDDDVVFSRRTVNQRGRTRSEVPLFSPRRTEARSTHTVSLANRQPFSRFRQNRRFGSDAIESSLSTVFSPSSSAAAVSPTLAPSIAARDLQVSPTISVPLIPVKDPDHPRVVVTNGQPFVPQLDVVDPVPAREGESEYNSLALPETNFTCDGKISGGYYADPETECRMYHICFMGANNTITDFKLLCGNNTVFEQKTRTCQETEKVDCASSASNYNVNDHLIVPKWLERLNGKQVPASAIVLSRRIGTAAANTTTSPASPQTTQPPQPAQPPQTQQPRQAPQPLSNSSQPQDPTEKQSAAAAPMRVSLQTRVANSEAVIIAKTEQQKMPKS